MNQFKFGAIHCYLLKVWGKLHDFVQVAIGFGFPSHWLISWLEIIKPITKHSKLLYNMAIIAIA